METQPKSIKIEELFRKYSERILNYISTRVENREDAENLSQDVWIKALEAKCDIMIETALSYLYRIATNLINDYLRRLYVRLDSRDEIERSYAEQQPLTPAQAVVASELAALEEQRVECLPSQRRIIYIMSRYEDRTVSDIASELSLSFRTVENHLRMGRRDVRNFLTATA